MKKKKKKNVIKIYTVVNYIKRGENFLLELFNIDHQKI